ncbi:MAG: hypothetical protein U0Z44_12225 [Kouleothrix sp.]
MTSMPARPGQFGPYGGSYIPETLVPAVAALDAAYTAAKADPAFWDELNGAPQLHRPADRADLRWPADRAARRGAQIYLKREGPGPHRRAQDQQRARPGATGPAQGKTRIIAETGAGWPWRGHRHRVCATSALECVVRWASTTSRARSRTSSAACSAPRCAGSRLAHAQRRDQRSHARLG